MPIYLKRYTKKELMNQLGISSYDAFRKAIKGIEDLGSYTLGRFNELQVEKICKHLGEPMIYPPNWDKAQLNR